MRLARNKSPALAAIAFAALAASGCALAQAQPVLAKQQLWRSECGGCHIAYPPRLLTASDWRTLMGALDRHFGSDASLDARSAADIARFLEADAGRHAGGAASGLPRITEARWFIREHRETGGDRGSTSFAAKSSANCEACHPRAADGRFDEDEVSVERRNDRGPR
jgi:hypothetical protein